MFKIINVDGTTYLQHTASPEHSDLISLIEVRVIVADSRDAMEMTVQSDAYRAATALEILADLADECPELVEVKFQ